MKKAVFYLLTGIFLVVFVKSSPVKATANLSITAPTSSATTSSTPTFSGIGPADETVLVLFDGTYAGTADVGLDNHWSYTPGILPAGAHTVQAVYLKNFYVFVSDLGDHNISVINSLTDEYLTNFGIDDSAQLQDVVLTPNHSKAYILDINPLNQGVWVVDAENFTLGDTPITDGGNHPQAAAVSSDGGLVYIVNNYSGDMSVLDTSTDTFVAGSPFSFGEDVHPADIAVSDNFAYVADNANNQILIISLVDNSVAGVIPLGCSPSSLAIDNPHNYLYVTTSCGWDENYVDLVDTASDTLLTMVPVDGIAMLYPQALAVTSDGSKLISLDAYDNKAYIFDTDSMEIIDEIPTGATPMAVAINKDDLRAYVTNLDGDSVSVINLTDYVVTSAINVGSHPNGLGILEDYYFSPVVNFTVAVNTAPTPTPTPAPAHDYEYVSGDITPTPTTLPTPSPPARMVANTLPITDNQTGVNRDVVTKSNISWARISLWILIVLIALVIAWRVYKYYSEPE